VGIILQVMSDFLLNDVNFALTPLNEEPLHNFRQESQNSLLEAKLPPGSYDLMIYTHNCLSTASNPIQNMDVTFKVHIAFTELIHEGGKVQDSFEFWIDGKPEDTELVLFLKPQEKCARETDSLPTILDYSVLNTQRTYSLMGMSRETHEMALIQYPAAQILTITVNRANAEISVKGKEVYSEGLADDNAVALVVDTSQLSSSDVILFEFEPLDKETGKFECLEFTIDFKTMPKQDACSVHPDLPSQSRTKL